MLRFPSYQPKSADYHLCSLRDEPTRFAATELADSRSISHLCSSAASMVETKHFQSNEEVKLDISETQ